MIPNNKIEELLEHPMFGPADYPEIYRLMVESDLVFLQPLKPNQPIMRWKESDGVPKFVPWGSVYQGVRIPVFSSLRAARIACREVGGGTQFTYCEINGRELCTLLAKQKESIALNPACSAHAMAFSPDSAAMLADGSILVPDADTSVKGRLELLDPRLYPHKLVRSVIQFSKKHDIQGAWLFKDNAAKKNCYVFILETRRDPEQITNDFSLVAKLTCPDDAEWGVRVLESSDPELARVTKKFPAFYKPGGHCIYKDC